MLNPELEPKTYTADELRAAMLKAKDTPLYGEGRYGALVLHPKDYAAMVEAGIIRG